MQEIRKNVTQYEEVHQVSNKGTLKQIKISKKEEKITKK